jgi:cell division protein FtsB
VKFTVAVSGRIPAIAGGLALLAFALFAGEYGTGDWLKMRRDLGAERQRMVELKAQVDSLARLAEALANDPATQERVAREEFGMIRDGEILYRVVPR